jgi:hypothetical protein
MGISPGLLQFKITYEISPIILTGGIATNLPGGMLPIVSLTESNNFPDGLLSGGDDLGLDDFFAHFVPLPGSKLASNQFGQYPFANQAVAANARIKQPLTISMRMICPVKDDGGYATKQTIIQSLQATLAQHDAMGGTYTVMTPSFPYVNCVLLEMTDTSNGASAQAQNTYQFDFWQPLLTLQDAQQAQNNLMSQISAGTPINGMPSWSGLSPTVGNPASLGAIGTIPAASGAGGASTASPSLPLPGPQPQ